MAKKKSKTTSDDLIKKQNEPAQTDKAQPEKKKSKTLSDELLEKYLLYANSEEAFAVLFVKKYLNAATGKWIDIIEPKNGLNDESVDEHVSNLEFEFVECELFQRKLQPKYPPKKDFILDGVFHDLEYLDTCRAITWHTAHEDISQQRAKKIKGLLFRLYGTFIEIPNPNYKKGFFLDEAPIEIKALANNLDDRSDPLWNEARKYINYTRDQKTFKKFEFKRVEYVKR